MLAWLDFGQAMIVWAKGDSSVANVNDWLGGSATDMLVDRLATVADMTAETATYLKNRSVFLARMAARPARRVAY
jgi:hypothetical protein